MTTGLVQRSFAGGEIAPALGARADQIKYQTGLKRCRNFRVQKHGGVSNRPGLEHVVEVKDSAANTYLLDFVFNDEQTYIIEAGNGYFRFIRAGAQIVVSGVPAWSAATNYVVGDLAAQGGINYYCIAAHINQVPPNATYWYPLTGVIYEIPTPYAIADVPDIQITQSGDVVTLTHPSYAVRELTRTGHTTWVLALKAFEPSIATPTGFAVTAPGAGAFTWRYKVTAVMTETYEESLAASASDTGDAPATANVHTLAWNVVSGAVEYNIYREYPRDSGVYGFVGVAQNNNYSHDGSIVPNTLVTPPIARNPFNATNDYPSTTGYYQQRQLFANTNNAPEKLWGSRSAMFDNFTISSPLQDDDAVTFTVVSKKVNEIRHLVDLGALVVLTASGEFIAEGDSEGTLRASQPPNLRQIGSNGSSVVAPVTVDSNLLYLQARGTVLRDLRYEAQSGGALSTYKGRDLTVFATHLFKNHQITRLAYAQTPDSIIYAVRDDGILLGLTYLPDHEVWGWHWHDTNGWFEDVRVVPEGDEDAIYVVVRRIINGVTKRYIERFTTRDFEDIEVDAVFLDSYLSYDGRNTSATTLRIKRAASYLRAPFVVGNYGSTPDSAANSIVGDIDIRIKLRATDWTPSVSQAPIAKALLDPNRSWVLFLDTDGTLLFQWFPLGTVASGLARRSTVATGLADNSDIFLRVTLDVDNGAAGHTVRFYTSTDYDQDSGAGTWTQLGADVVTAGVTAIADTAAGIEIGARNGGAASNFNGRVYYAEVRNGIGGSIVATFDPRRTYEGSTSFVSQTGETWTINETASALLESDDTWTSDEPVFLVASAGTFVAGDVGNEFVLHILDADEESDTFGEALFTVRVAVTGYTSATVVSGNADRDVPTELRDVATDDWSRAVDQLAGLSHLEGKNVGVFADGHVVASPNNDEFTIVTVSSGSVTLDRPYSVIHVGLPYLCDLQTLDIDRHGEEWRDRTKNVTHLSVLVEATRGLFAGPDEDNLAEFEPSPIVDYDEPIPQTTGVIEMPIASTWNNSGSVFIRQVDPLPASVLAVVPAGLIGG